MKVAHIMSKQVEHVDEDTSVRDVCRLIFGSGISGIPVCRGKRVIGFISERDILAKLYPTMQEYIEDRVHATDFEGMEEKVSEIFALTAKDIMNKNPVTISSNTPLLKAQSMMFLHKVGRMPVVDENGDLIGILTKSDIFKAVVGEKLPLHSSEEYHDWLSKHYDLTVNWVQRLGNEVPNLTTLFRKESVENIIDIGYGTGEHDIVLAEEGFNILGIESSPYMAKTAESKLNKASKEAVKRVKFLSGDTIEILKSQEKQYDAAIFMGNAFGHLADNYERVLDVVDKTLNKKNAIIVFQIANFNKILNVLNRFQNISFAKSKSGLSIEHAFIEFYDPPREKGGHLTLTMTVLDHDDKKWTHRSTNSTPIVNLDEDKMKNLLIEHEFKNVSIFGGSREGPLFKHPFDPFTSDWLNIVAKR